MDRSISRCQYVSSIDEDRSLNLREGEVRVSRKVTEDAMADSGS